MIKKISYFVCILLFLLSNIYSTQVEVTITEEIEVTKLFSGSFSLETNGVLEIRNPSNYSKVYEFNIPLSLDSLIGISKSDVDSTSSRFDFTFEKIKGYTINPNETIKVGYTIYGLQTDNILTKLDVNESVLEYYSDFEFVTKTILNLQKPEREGLRYNDDGSLNNSEGSNTSQRLVTAGIRNPSDFELFARKIDLYTTTAGDPMFDSGDLLASFANNSIDSFGYIEFDVFDPASINNSVYWVSSNIIILPNVTTALTKTTLTQQTSGGGGSGRGSSGGGGSISIPDQDFSDSLLVKKSVDKTLIRSGDEFKVFLTIVNIEDIDLEYLTLLDEIPEGHEIKDVSREVIINGNSLEFSVDTLEAYSSITISYTLINNKEFSGITYLKPATLVFDEINFFSDGILVINDLLPDKKVFIQKEVDIVDEEYARVTLKVRNLGSIELNDLLVSDDIPEDAILKEISKIFFERGSWKINTLLPGEEWEVSYLVERNPSIDNLPNVFGVEQENVYGTLISSEEIVTVFQENPRTIERVGLIVSVGLLIFYLLF